MNPLTNIKNLNAMNERELDMGVAGTSTSWHNEYRDSAWIFLGGLPYELTEGDLLAVFSQYGEIVHINLVRDHATGKSRGFGFVCYEDQRSTILAVDNLNGIRLCKRTIRVDHVQTYKLPKDLEKMDADRKRLFLEGCAPKPIGGGGDDEGTDEEDELSDRAANGAKKKKKKDKKKKKKKDKRKESDEDGERSPVSRRGREMSPEGKKKDRNSPDTKKRRDRSSTPGRRRRDRSPVERTPRYRSRSPERTNRGGSPDRNSRKSSDLKQRSTERSHRERRSRSRDRGRR